jgi:YlmC/YmxH family sporulation protein
VVKISDLRMREVINIGDGRRLGPIKDIDINMEEGKITAIILPGQGGRLMGFLGRDDEIVVPWDRIYRIGVDVILVDLRPAQDGRREGSDPGYFVSDKYW